MQDLTTGSLTRHLLKTTGFMLVTLVSHTLYFLVDLYWVGRLGSEAVAAVAISGNLMFAVLAVTQMLAVGTTTLVSHAAGRKDRDRDLLLNIVPADWRPRPDLWRETLRTSLTMAVGAMIVFAALCHVAPAAMIGVFSQDPRVIAVGDEYLRIVSWNFVASGVVFVSSSMFQALGNTLPALASSCLRVLGVTLPLIALSRTAGFELLDLVSLRGGDRVPDGAEPVAAPTRARAPASRPDRAGDLSTQPP